MRTVSRVKAGAVRGTQHAVLPAQHVMPSLTVSSPAKINLFLKVLGRRRDGYHNLLTLFHRVSLADTLRLERRAKGFKLTCSDPRLSTGEDNLITRAWRLLEKRFPRIGGMRVHLTKKIPVGAGLGGGSSNAAAFLRAANRLCRLGLSPKELAVLGRQLGADVPFFIFNINQGIGTERGDKIRPRPVRAKWWFLLLISSRGLSTPKVYQALPRPLPAVFLTKLSRSVTMTCDFLEAKDLLGLSRQLDNDLEKAAFRLRPSLRKQIAQLNNMGIPAVRMSGSGPTLFAVFPQAAPAQKVMRHLRRVLPSKKIILCHSF